MGILSLPGTKGAAEYAVNKSAKALAKAEEGAQGVGDFFGNVSSHMFGGAMMGGVGNTALYANAGDGYNGVQGYAQAFFSGATAGAIAGGALGAYRGVGRATASDARIARLQAKHEKNQAVLARRSGGGGGGRKPNRIGLSPLDQTRELIAGDRAGGFTPGVGRGRMKTSTSTAPMNPISTAQAPTPAAAAATPTPTPSQAASTATAGTTASAAVNSPAPRQASGNGRGPFRQFQGSPQRSTTISKGANGRLRMKSINSNNGVRAAENGQQINNVNGQMSMSSMLDGAHPINDAGASVNGSLRTMRGGGLAANHVGTYTPQPGGGFSQQVGITANRSKYDQVPKSSRQIQEEERRERQVMQRHLETGGSLSDFWS